MAYGSHYREHIAARSAERQAVHRPNASLGVAGHYLREAGILAPLIISEVVKDGEKRWRLIRIASITTALVSEGMWAAKIHRDREAAREREAMRQSLG